MESDNDSDVGDLLADLLANDETEEVQSSETPTKGAKLVESSLNFLDHETNVVVPTQLTSIQTKTVVHNGDTDSSDEEDNRNFEHEKYSSYGREVKKILKSNESETNSSHVISKTPSASFVKNYDKELRCPPATVKTESKDVYFDPIFGLRIINPVVSSASLKERMVGRTAVTVSKIKYHLKTGDLQSDWVIAGVLIHKSPIRSSQKGNQYCIWKMSDLSDGIKSVSLFLFRDAYKTFWKTNTGTVFGVLNPGVMDNRDENVNEAALSIDNAQRIMILGVSKDMGICKSRKRNGEPCTSIVNTYKCEYCVYHVQQEYNKCARRSDLQSSSSGRGVSLNNLRNKVLGKGETIYGGRTFTAVPAKQNHKLVAKDRARLQLLQNPGLAMMNSHPERSNKNLEITKKASLVELTSKQMQKDSERLAKLRGSVPGIQQSSTEPPTSSSIPVNRQCSKLNSISPSSSTSNNICVPIASNITKPHLSLSKSSTVMNIPQLGVGLVKGMIDLSEPIPNKSVQKAKVNAIKWIQRNGAIKKTNPNRVRATLEEKNERGTKRQREISEETEQTSKKQNAFSSTFQAMIAVTSKHTDLVEQSDEQEKEKYFNKLEIKEKMEEKMMTTFKVDCKAVKCLICKYTAFSASDMCKDQKHPLRVTDAVKRFFKCGDCKNRTITLDRLPSHTCKNCQSSNWIRTAMMDERKVEIPGKSLSIRGGEEKFIGSVVKNSLLDLLVPES